MIGARISYQRARENLTLEDQPLRIQIWKLEVMDEPVHATATGQQLDQRVILP